MDAKAYNNLLIAPACIYTLCIARYLTLEIGIAMNTLFIIINIEDTCIYFFEVNTKYISSSAVKKSVFFTSA